MPVPKVAQDSAGLWITYVIIPALISFGSPRHGRPVSVMPGPANIKRIRAHILCPDQDIRIPIIIPAQLSLGYHMINVGSGLTISSKILIGPGILIQLSRP
jgi:hypothetical protein